MKKRVGLWFALNVLDKNQDPIACTFFKPAESGGQKISEEVFHSGKEGAAILDNTAAHIECRLIESLEKGDHSFFIGEVGDAGVRSMPDGRADDVMLYLKDLGDKIYYGG